MLLSASVLAGCAPDVVQQRAIARYTFLYGDTFLLWARRWRRELSHDDANARLSGRAKKLLRALADVLEAPGQVRHYLAAKRQPPAVMRADDINGTSRLWAAISPENVGMICDAVVDVYDALAQGPASIIVALKIDGSVAAQVRVALPQRDRDFWYLAADTAADLRPYTLPAAQGGELGRLIAQINDVANHLDALLRIAPVLYGVLPYDWLVRSALLVEVNALLDLALGPPPGHKPTVLYPLTTLCRRSGDETASEDLLRLRESIGAQGWNYVRWARDHLGAHLDDELTCFQVHQHLVQLDYNGIIRLVEHLLDFLDAVGANNLGLKLLLIGERRLGSWPTSGASAAPKRAVLTGALAELFRRIDSPLIFASASSQASAAVAGITSGRQPRPRVRVSVPEKWDPLLHPAPPHLSACILGHGV